jgi:ankyrin repeat protein
MGNAGLVQWLLDKRADPNIHDGYFRPPLEQACKNGHYDTVHLLLEKGAHINLGYERPRDAAVKGPIFLACLHGHQDIVRLLMEPKYRLSPRLSILKSAIIPAIQGGHVELVQWLMQLPSREDTSLKTNGDAMLTEAVRHSRESVAGWLLENGIHPNNEKEWQRVWNHQPSILQIAALRGRVPIVCLLLQAGANRFVAALTFAARNNHVDVAQVLLESANTEQDCLSMVHGRHPFESKAEELTEHTPLLQAVKKGSLSMVRWLLERRVHVNFVVVQSVKNDDYEILKLLLKAKKSYHFNPASEWMLGRAKERGDWRTLELLMEVRAPSSEGLLMAAGDEEDIAMSG